MLHAQKMDIRFLFVRPVMIRKKKKLLQRVIPKELEIKPVTAIPPEASDTLNVIYNSLFFLSDNIPING